MTAYLLWIFLLAIWNNVVFFDNELGINVLLFVAPLMYYLYYVLKKNDMIKNKKGLLYIIPILLLSMTFMLFNGDFLILNIFAIPVLIALMFIHTTDSTYKICSLFKRIISFIFVPYKYIARLYRVTTAKISTKFKKSNNDNLGKIIKALIIVIPITIIVIALLSKADMIFGEMFGDLLDYLLEILEFDFIDKLIGRIVCIIIMFFVIGCTTMYVMYEKKKEEKVKKAPKERDLLTAKILLVVLNIIYVIFDFIQIKSLVLHSLSTNIDYAYYARQGFFELLVVSIINITILLIIRRFETTKNEKEYNLIKIMSVLMIFLTIIIICSSFLRMNMYVIEYGYTTLRFLVFAALITESVLMIPTVMYIFNKNFNIVKSYMIITLIAYLCVHLANIDYVIAKSNIDRYFINDTKIDIDYLKNYRYDNIPMLLYLYDNTDDAKIKEDLNNYLCFMSNNNNDNIFEFNVSRYRAIKLLDKRHFEYTNVDYSDYE